MGKQGAEFRKFYEFKKMEEDADGTPVIWGIATLEQPDSDQEICSYESAVPVYRAWSAAALKRTKGAGQSPSLGNLRLQHGSEVGGKATKLEFKDDAKEIWLGAEPINEEVHKQLKNGFYTGFSQGGSYAWRACADCEGQMPMQQGANFCENCGKIVQVMYGLKRLAEVSFVDSPATGVGFESVKANGSCSIVKFAKKESTVAKTKTVAGTALPSHCFAYVGDEDKTETWKLPIEFPGDDKKTKSHIRNALARFDQTKGIPDGEKAKVKAKIEAAARSHGIDVDGQKSVNGLEVIKGFIDTAAEAKGLTKGLYDVSRFAEVVMNMASVYEWAVIEREIEGDESEVPDELKEILDRMIESFLAMATEEAKELSAKKTETGDATMKTQEELDLEKAAKKSLASHFAKAASHHEKMADKEEKMADIHTKADVGCKDCMGKAASAKSAKIEAAKADAVAKREVYKEDVGSGADAGDVHSVLENQQAYHKAMAGEHMKKAAMHDKMADHYTKMAEMHDDSSDKADTAAILKAEREVVEPEPLKLEPKVATMDDDVKNAAAAMRNTPEYKASIEAIAKAQVAAEVDALKKTTLAPLGIQIDEATGEAVLKGAKIVKRDEDKEEFVFAGAPPVNNTGGL